eukprot:252032_1
MMWQSNHCPQICNKCKTHWRSLSKAMENQNNTMKQFTEKVSKLEESKDEHYNLQTNEIVKRMSALQQQVNGILSANSWQPKQQTNQDHEKVRKWLKNDVNLERYYAMFIENGFEDLESIQSLNMEILNTMQIEKIG